MRDEQNQKSGLRRTFLLRERLASTACVIAASGGATRLRPLLDRLGWPDKPTLPIAGVSLLERNVAAAELLGIRTVVVTLPASSASAADQLRQAHPRLAITSLVMPPGTSHGAFRDALNMLDRSRFDRALLLYGDTVPHLEALAAALLSRHDQIVVVAHRSGDGGMQLRCDPESRILSVDLDYSRHGPYPVAWLFDLTNLEALNAQPEPNIDRLLVECLAGGNWAAVEARYPRSLDGSFNLNDAQDLDALTRIVESDPLPFGYPGDLDQRGSLVTLLRILDDDEAVKRLLASNAARRRPNVGTPCAVSAALALAAAALAGPWLMVTGTAGSLVVAALGVVLLGVCALSPYAAMNLRMAARILFRRAAAAPACELHDQRLPKVSVVVPVRNEPVEIVQRTLNAVAASDYPKDRLEVVLVSGAATVEPRLHDEAYQNLITAHPFMRMRQVDYEPGLVNGKSRSLNAVLGELDGDYVNPCDADTFYTPGDLRHMVARADQIRETTGDTLALVQFARRVDPEILGTRAFLALLRHHLHDIVLDHFVTPERFALGFPGSFGHALLLPRTAALDLAHEDPRGRLFNEEQRIEDLDLAFRIRATGRFTIHFANDVAIAEGIPLTWRDHLKRLAALLTGDTRLLLSWVSRLVRSGSISRASRIQIVLHLSRGLATLSVCLLPLILPAFCLLPPETRPGRWLSALVIALLVLIFPSLASAYGQPVIVAAAAVKLCLRRERRSAYELLLLYPLLYFFLLATNPIVAWSSLRAVVYRKQESFMPTPKSRRAGPGRKTFPIHELFGIGFASAASIGLAATLVQAGLGWLLGPLAAYAVASAAYYIVSVRSAPAPAGGTSPPAEPSSAPWDEEQHPRARRRT